MTQQRLSTRHAAVARSSRMPNGNGSQPFSAPSGSLSPLSRRLHAPGRFVANATSRPGRSGSRVLAPDRGPRVPIGRRRLAVRQRPGPAIESYGVSMPCSTFGRPDGRLCMARGQPVMGSARYKVCSLHKGAVSARCFPRSASPLRASSRPRQRDPMQRFRAINNVSVAVLSESRQSPPPNGLVETS